MVGGWEVAAMVVVIGGSLLHQLIRLRRNRMRFEHLGRIVSAWTAPTTIDDRDGDGAVTTIRVGSPTRAIERNEAGAIDDLAR